MEEAHATSMRPPADCLAIRACRPTPRSAPARIISKAVTGQADLGSHHGAPTRPRSLPGSRANRSARCGDGRRSTDKRAAREGARAQYFAMVSQHAPGPVRTERLRDDLVRDSNREGHPLSSKRRDGLLQKEDSEQAGGASPTESPADLSVSLCPPLSLSLCHSLSASLSLFLSLSLYLCQAGATPFPAAPTLGPSLALAPSLLPL